MSWTEERTATLKKMWEGGATASQIADGLLDAVRIFSDDAEISDDRTIVTLKVD